MLCISTPSCAMRSIVCCEFEHGPVVSRPSLPDKPDLAHLPAGGGGGLGFLTVGGREERSAAASRPDREPVIKTAPRSNVTGCANGRPPRRLTALRLTPGCPRPRPRRRRRHKNCTRGREKAGKSPKHNGFRAVFLLAR